MTLTAMANSIWCAPTPTRAQPHATCSFICCVPRTSRRQDEFYGLLLHAAVNIPAAFNKPANPPSEAYDYLQIFDYYDTNRSGLLDVRELHAALNDMQLGATIDDAIDLVRQYSTSTIDRLDPQAFSLLLNDLTTMPAWGPWTHATPPYQYMFTERPDARRPAPIGMPNYFATTMLLPATVGSVFDGCDGARHCLYAPLPNSSHAYVLYAHDVPPSLVSQ